MRPRLLAVAELLPRCNTFYDIGTDHGLLPAFLLESGRCRKAVLSDISPDSLNKAKELFRKRGLAGQFHVADGLTGLSPGADDAIAVCGMGAQVILRILSGGIPCPAVLLPSARAEDLRVGLGALPITVVQERLVREGRRYYCCFLIQPGEPTPVSQRSAYIAERLYDDPLYMDYLLWKKAVTDRAAKDGSPDELLAQRRQWIKEALCGQ